MRMSSQGQLQEHIPVGVNLKQLEKVLYDYIKEIHNINELLIKMADELDESFKAINIAKITGASTAVAGGILSAVGFALSFATFGASLALYVAGGVMCGAGGLTVGGAEIANVVKSLSAMKVANENITKYNDKAEIVRKLCLDIGAKLEGYGEIDTTFASWVEFWAKLTGAGINVGWSAIGRSIGVGLNITDSATRVTASAGMTLAKSVGTGVGRGLHIAGGVVGVLLLPLDIYTLVDSAIDFHKENPHKISESIRKVAEDMMQNCPSEDAIKNMIESVKIALNRQAFVDESVEYQQLSPINQLLHQGWDFVIQLFLYLMSFCLRNISYNCNCITIVILIVAVVVLVAVI